MQKFNSNGWNTVSQPHGLARGQISQWIGWWTSGCVWFVFLVLQYKMNLRVIRTKTLWVMTARENSRPEQCLIVLLVNNVIPRAGKKKKQAKSKTI